MLVTNFGVSHESFPLTKRRISSCYCWDFLGTRCLIFASAYTAILHNQCGDTTNRLRSRKSKLSEPSCRSTSAQNWGNFSSKKT